MATTYAANASYLRGSGKNASTRSARSARSTQGKALWDVSVSVRTSKRWLPAQHIREQARTARYAAAEAMWRVMERPSSRVVPPRSRVREVVVKVRWIAGASDASALAALAGRGAPSQTAWQADVDVVVAKPLRPEDFAGVPGGGP